MSLRRQTHRDRGYRPTRSIAPKHAISVLPANLWHLLFGVERGGGIPQSELWKDTAKRFCTLVYTAVDVRNTVRKSQVRLVAL